MKYCPCIRTAVWVLCLLFTCVAAYAQPGTPSDGDNSNQWLSHQMNQPPPGATRITSTAQDRVDDIRQLYELAKREAQAGGQRRAVGSR
ncbi:MAG: hypothetical protein V1792_02740 [Pseudomonadota bacterium]